MGTVFEEGGDPKSKRRRKVRRSGFSEGHSIPSTWVISGELRRSGKPLAFKK
jgi:hypothetical protein